jgi:hypothetical protein
MIYDLEKAREIDGFFVERYKICIRAITWWHSFIVDNSGLPSNYGGSSSC